jgi:uncharacterized membrane protein
MAMNDVLLIILISCLLINAIMSAPVSKKANLINKYLSFLSAIWLVPFLMVSKLWFCFSIIIIISMISVFMACQKSKALDRN